MMWVFYTIIVLIIVSFGVGLSVLIVRRTRQRADVEVEPDDIKKFSRKWWLEVGRALLVVIAIEIFVAVLFPHWLGVLIRNPWFLIAHLLVPAVFLALSKPDPAKKDYKVTTAGKWALWVFAIGYVYLIIVNWPYWTVWETGKAPTTADGAITKSDPKQTLWQDIKESPLLPGNWDKPDPLRVALDNAKEYSGMPGETITVVIPPRPTKPGDPGEWVKIRNFGFWDPPSPIRGYTDRMTRISIGTKSEKSINLDTQWMWLQSADEKPVEFKVMFLSGK